MCPSRTLVPMKYFAFACPAFNNSDLTIIFNQMVDVIQNQDDPNKFIFYEMYVDLDAVMFHKEQPHFALWTEFKASGGVVSSVSHKCDGLFISE